MKQYSLMKFILILTPFVFSFAFGLDIYIPIVPEMSAILNTSPSLIQLTLSLFLAMTGLGQIVLGPFSDSFGRKKTLLLSALLYASGSFLCIASEGISLFLIGRLVSATGACGMLVTSFAIVRDLFSQEESARMYSLLNGAIGISPTFAPIIGGYLFVYLGWKSIFIFLTLLGLISFYITQKLIFETHAKEKRVPMNRDVFINYLSVLKNRQFLIFSTIAGFASGALFCFFSLSPFILVDVLKIPTDQFGYYFAVFGAMISIGGFASGKSITLFGIYRTIAIGLTLIFSGGLMMLLWNFANPITIPSFLIPMAIASLGSMFLFGVSASLCLEPFKTIAGTASAAFGAIELGISAIIGSILMLFSTTSVIPYGMILTLLATCSFLLFQLREKTVPVVDN